MCSKETKESEFTWTRTKTKTGSLLFILETSLIVQIQVMWRSFKIQRLQDLKITKTVASSLETTMWVKNEFDLIKLLRRTLLRKVGSNQEIFTSTSKRMIKNKRKRKNEENLKKRSLNSMKIEESKKWWMKLSSNEQRNSNE